MKDETKGPRESKTKSGGTEGLFGRCEIGLDKILESLPYSFYVIDAFDFTIKAANEATQLGPLTDASTCYALTHNRRTPCGSSLHPCPIEEIKKTGAPVSATSGLNKLLLSEKTSSAVK